MKQLLSFLFVSIVMLSFVNELTAQIIRIRFARGRTSTSVSGTIGSIGERDYVLRAFAGQYLSATVSSRGGCIKFSTISTSQAYTTDDGDNYLKLMNMCRRSASFTMTVSIR